MFLPTATRSGFWILSNTYIFVYNKVITVHVFFKNSINIYLNIFINFYIYIFFNTNSKTFNANNKRHFLTYVNMCVQLYNLS